MTAPVPSPRLTDRPEDLRALLGRVKTIAVVGASMDPWRPSFGVTGYLHRQGYRLIPVNPMAVGQDLFGEPFRAKLQDIGEQVDLVNVFRRPEHVPGVVEDAIAIGAPAIWLQLGIVNLAAAAQAEAAGIAMVMNRCISVEHSRLMR
ncbi:CoA-binding protein [Microvirga pudoricolor]|uniref:CoA-binding protein n=1 Tax=Microvirga pudoricolor TaxID=2778729 RepID=UPI001950F3DF|nr:CoA-binding protein [Microvirga pudoricolor]MBM6596592.1 CoA-binding protein [Microvirga pudoricolor]